MARRAWLIVSFAALLGLRAPLCLYACGSGLAVPSAHAAEQPAPCHADETPEPEQPASSDHACDCDRLRYVHSSADTSQGLHPFSTAASPVAAAAFAAFRPGWPARLPVRDRHHPPPDLLLLNSTLLL